MNLETHIIAGLIVAVVSPLLLWVFNRTRNIDVLEYRTGQAEKDINGLGRKTDDIRNELRKELHRLREELGNGR